MTHAQAGGKAKGMGVVGSLAPHTTRTAKPSGSLSVFSGRAKGRLRPLDVRVAAHWYSCTNSTGRGYACIRSAR
jgi:hypothetical protein